MKAALGISLALACAVLMTACAPVHYRNSEHPSWGQAEFNRDQYQCQRENATQILQVNRLNSLVNTEVDQGIQPCMAAHSWRPIN
jgi:hypothetical protein